MKGNYSATLIFEVADAVQLPYQGNTFAVIIIANALHVMPEPEQALKEIDRVLRKDGVLIAPNFVGHKSGIPGRFWAGILKIAGISFEHQWTGDEYIAWLRMHGWETIHSKLLPSRITLMYVECMRKADT